MQRQSETNHSSVSAIGSERPSVSLHDVLNAVPEESAARPPWLTPTQVFPAVVIGRLAGLEKDGTPRVEFAGNTSGRHAGPQHGPLGWCGGHGSEVALVFEDGDPARPIIIGAIGRALAGIRPASLTTPSAINVEATADGERMTISANQEVELRCGKASITLTRAGKVLIRGAYLLSRSSGVNRIKGGSVQIN